jgi:hypothetical protein
MSGKKRSYFSSRFWLHHVFVLVAFAALYIPTEGDLGKALLAGVFAYLLPAFAFYVRGFGTRKELKEYYMRARK